ncbi:hypothetical protein EJ02DRAFT_450874 [Clathrospora elynae]|uniref:Protamine P1 n=1 Tax=Clathrospora elynae TaxID=706981 RepID=A0A6A5T316_9PLEO|nr:hypothetical protein EJ02DRAFT_450874 [Clathrospora elynae]
MPPTLHPHLKRDLDYDDYDTNPEDVIEDLPAEYRDPAQCAAKRRRIEAIACQYLRGRPPLILSAALRGPFNDGWKNPWTPQKRNKRRSSNKSSATMSARSTHNAKNATEDTSTTTKVQRIKRKGVAKEAPAPQITSPEASRAAQDDLHILEQDYSLNNVEVLPATAPLPDENDTSSATDFFSAMTEKCIYNRSSPTNPFWLRRPESATRVDMRQATNELTVSSPIRSRSRNEQSRPGPGGELQPSLPKAPMQAHVSPRKLVVPDDWRSSASASMIISSPVKGASVARSESNAHAKPATNALSHPSVLEKPSPIKPNGVTSSMASQGRPTREDIQHSAERLVDLMPASSASSKEPRRSSRNGTQDVLIPAAPGHDLVTLTAPASAPAFIYRKKRQGGDGQKQKPRAVNFNSSPLPKEKATVVTEKSAQSMATIHESADDAPPKEIAEGEEASVQDPQEAEEDTTVIQEQNQELRTSRSSRGSDWSTQAAMILAQLEFQQSTTPSMRSETSRACSQPSQDTLRSISAVPSPAITPLSVFGARLDKTLPNTSALRGPPISTQDLFGAASPFAFSTVKKKPEDPPQSNLKFAFMSNDHDDLRANGTTARSPTPSADRIPLKAKNTATSFWSFVTDKASQASQKSLVDRSRRSFDDGELPQSDFATPLDDFGPIGGLLFTDRFLRNIDDT